MMAQETGGTGTGHRSVTFTRLEKGLYEATNVRGGTLRFGGGGDGDEFTPVELLLTAIAGCGATDVDFIVSKRAEPTRFEVVSEGVKTKDAEGRNEMSDLRVTFTVRFEDGEAGDRAREMLPKAIAMSHDRLCTVTRTVVKGTPVEEREA